MMVFWSCESGFVAGARELGVLVRDFHKQKMNGSRHQLAFPVEGRQSISFGNKPGCSFGDQCHYISEDCCLQIFKRLQVKSLARCRCVCKRWNALICSSSFIADHLACSKSKPRLFIYGVYQPHARRIEKGSVIFDSDSPDVGRASFIHTFKTEHQFGLDARYELVGSVKGVVCLNMDRDIVLWNPVISKYIQLPKKRVSSNSLYLDILVAVGVKPSEDDDIRVLLVSAFYTMRKDKFVNAVAEIYSVRHGGWRALQTDLPSFHVGYHRAQSYANGAVHWVASKEDYSSLFILCFNFENEEFSSISLGKYLGRLDCFSLYAAVHGGKLAVVESRSSKTIWVMGEYGNSDSWSVVTCIDKSPGRYMYVKGITNDGRILLCPGIGKELLMYDPTSQTYSKLAMKAADHRFCGCGFTESLVFMDGEGGAISLPSWTRLPSCYSI